MDNFLLASMPSIIALLQCAFCSIGFILKNGFLVFVLCRNKDLRSSCCAKLILAMAVYDCFHEYSLIFIPPILTVSGHQISVQLCFFLLFYGPYALLNSGTLILLISLDRLFAVIHPIRYKTFTIDHKGKYLTTLILLPAIFHWSSIYQNYQFVLNDPGRLVFCQPTDFMGPARIQTELYGSLLCIIAILSVYVGIWAMIKCKVVKKAQHKADRRLFTSLFVLIAIISIFGLPIPLIGKFVLPNLPIGPDFQNILYRCLLQLNKIGQASNAPVLYICSFDYRAAMQKEFSSILCRKKSNSRIFTLQQQNGTFYNGNPTFMNTVI